MPEVNKELTGAELARAVAEKVFGWTYREQEGTYPVYVNESGETMTAVFLFLPDSNVQQAYEMEEEIIRQGRGISYGANLCGVLREDLKKPVPWNELHDYEIAHASPEQRCRAALKVMEQ